MACVFDVQELLGLRRCGKERLPERKTDDLIPIAVGREERNLDLLDARGGVEDARRKETENAEVIPRHIADRREGRYDRNASARSLRRELDGHGPTERLSETNDLRGRNACVDE